VTNPDNKRYAFYISLYPALPYDEGGESVTVRWENLTRTQAQRMFKATEQRTPKGVFAYGWSEEGSA
jgi:hypothetical protein